MPKSAVVRCAAFALGNASSTRCPTSHSRLDTETACESAASVGGKEYGGTGEYAYYPAGCFWLTITGRAYLNTDTTGAANFYAKPLCAGAAMPARRFACVGFCWA
jgi:hypothetical protein